MLNAGPSMRPPMHFAGKFGEIQVGSENRPNAF